MGSAAQKEQLEVLDPWKSQLQKVSSQIKLKEDPVHHHPRRINPKQMTEKDIIRGHKYTYPNLEAQIKAFNDLPERDMVVNAMISMLYTCRDCALPSKYVANVLTLGTLVHAQYSGKPKARKVVSVNPKQSVATILYTATRDMSAKSEFTKIIMQVLMLSKFYPNVDLELINDLRCLTTYANFLHASSKDWGNSSSEYYINADEKSGKLNIALTDLQVSYSDNARAAALRICERNKTQLVDFRKVDDYRLNFRIGYHNDKRVLVSGRFRNFLD